MLQSPLARRRQRRKQLAKFLTALPFLTPNVIGFLLFIVIPVISVFVLSFYEWDFLSPPTFIGMENYAGLLGDPLFWISLKNTFVYIVVYVPVSIFLALVFAVLLNEKFRGAKVLKTIYFLPAVFSLVAVSIVWRFILDANFGVLNYILSLFGLPQVRWLINPDIALFSIVMLSLWKNLGYNMVIYLAGLQGIPTHLYEAATIDGASRIRQFFSITVPLLMPSTFFIVVTSVIGSFQVFDQVYVMTGGGPGSATRVFVFYLYQVAFQFFKMGQASAMAFILFIIIFVFTLVEIRLLNKATHYELG